METDGFTVEFVLTKNDATDEFLNPYWVLVDWLNRTKPPRVTSGKMAELLDNILYAHWARHQHMKQLRDRFIAEAQGQNPKLVQELIGLRQAVHVANLALDQMDAPSGLREGLPQAENMSFRMGFVSGFQDALIDVLTNREPSSFEAVSRQVEEAITKGPQAAKLSELVARARDIHTRQIEIPPDHPLYAELMAIRAEVERDEADKRTETAKADAAAMREQLDPPMELGDHASERPVDWPIPDAVPLDGELPEEPEQ